MCPEHELPLVPFDRLPPEKRRAPGADEPVAVHELRYGRGWLLAAAVLLLVGMALPMVTTVIDGHPVTASGYRLAGDRALNLWIIPAVAFALLSTLVRRRTPRQMRGSRIAVPSLGIFVACSLGYTLWRVHRAAAAIGVHVSVRSGFVVMAAAALLAIGVGARFGVTSRDGTGRRRGPPSRS